ncbi:hypothetical protein [Luteimonas lutimaris]|uniref:Uncharacterized protein n=1 Tax=Luteimonas lutimaris TaxID=698645 RepID=A0ABP7M3M0_9GAMM
MTTIGTGAMRPDGNAHPSTHNHGVGQAPQQVGDRQDANKAGQPVPTNESERPDGYQNTPSQQTLQQRTDQAHRKYAGTLSDLDKAKPGERFEVRRGAEEAFKWAVLEEIHGKIQDAYGQGTPYSTNELIRTYGESIRDRYAGDPRVASVIDRAISSALRNTAETRNEAILDQVEKIKSDSGISSEQKLVSLTEVLDGQPRSVVEKVLGDPDVHGWIKDACAYIDAPMKDAAHDNKAIKAYESAQRFVELTDQLHPALIANLVREELPNIRQIVRDTVGDDTYPLFLVTASLGRLDRSHESDLIIDDVAKAMLDAQDMWGSESNGGGLADLLYGSSLNSLDARLAVAVAEGLRSTGKLDLADQVETRSAEGIRDGMVKRTGGPLQEFEAANQAANETDKKLAVLLMRAEPLTSGEKEIFIQAFRADEKNQQVYDHREQAARQLVASWESAESRQAMLYALAHDPELSGYVQHLVEGLRNAGHADDAIKLLAAIKNDKAAFQTFESQQPGFVDGYLEQGIPSAFLEIMARNGGDTEAALVELGKNLEPFVVNTQAGAAAWQAIGMMASSPKASPFSAQTMADSFKSASALGKGFSCGLAALGLFVNVANGVSAQGLDDQIKAYGRAGLDVSQITMAAVKDMFKPGTLSNTTVELGDKFLQKIAPGLQTLFSSIEFVQSIDAAKADGDVDAGEALGIAGGLFSVVGSVVMFGSGPVGWLIAGGGILLKGIGEWISGRINADAQDRDLNRYLEQVVDPDLREAIVAGDAGQVDKLLSLGMSTEQLQELGVRCPNLFKLTAGIHTYDLDMMSATLDKAGINGDQFYRMLKYVDDAGATPGSGILPLLTALSTGRFPEAHLADSRTHLIEGLRNLQQQDFEPEWKRAFGLAADWLEEN